jgi:hypothetical protein
MENTPAQTDPDTKVAWLLCTELTTRITTQPLPLRDGDEATALTSVADFFKLARKTIAENPGCHRSADMTLNVLNTEVRPFTAKWHRRKETGRLHSMDERYTFRDDLRRVQGVLGRLAANLAVVAGMGLPLINAPPPHRRKGRSIRFGIRPRHANADDQEAVARHKQQIKHINRAEANEVCARRHAAGLKGRRNAIGLALSGGGIRSATFALGVVQELARRDLLKEVDFMSTVSGGGYLGSFISTHGLDRLAGISEKKEARHLRNHSKYLAEGGVLTWIQIALALLLGLLVTVRLLLPLLLLMFESVRLLDWRFQLAVLAGWGVSTYFVDFNDTGLHRYYRVRLTRTFLQKHQAVTLNALHPPGHPAPYHLINATLNVPDSPHEELRGRRSDHFLLSKHYCGSKLTGWHRTQDLCPDLTLSTAMSISGAAAAPHMGTRTLRRYTALMSLLGLRLGYWLDRRTLPDQDSAWFDRLMPPALACLLTELTGWRMHEKRRYLNLSDGGHIENLGVYELLRRRCRYIIAIDGECDPEHHFGGLLTLTRMAAIDLGVKIEPDLGDLRPNEQGWTNAHFVMARIGYPNSEGEGLLLYVKSSMTGNESEYLRHYRREHPAFPHESTAQQLFSETQFEAYRALGEHVGESLFMEHLVDESASKCISEWMHALAGKLLREDAGEAEISAHT